MGRGVYGQDIEPFRGDIFDAPLKSSLKPARITGDNLVGLLPGIDEQSPVVSELVPHERIDDIGFHAEFQRSEGQVNSVTVKSW